jgi:hypothetical protein
MMGNNQASGAPGADSAQDGGLAKLLATLGTSSQATNPDGSTTTTITYQDGSKVTLTMPVQQASGATTSTTTGQSGGRSAGHAANPLETLIQLQAQLFAAPAVGGKVA